MTFFVLGVYVDAFNELGQTALFIAAYTSDKHLVKLLLDLGADPNAVCVGGYTAVHGACFGGSGKILGKILDRGGDLGVHDCWRMTPR